MSIVKKLAINCKQATYLHEKRREGKLDLFERLGLWIHLAYCRFCAMFFKQLNALEKSSKNLGGISERLSDAVKERLQHQLDGELKK